MKIANFGPFILSRLACNLRRYVWVSATNFCIDPKNHFRRRSCLRKLITHRHQWASKSYR